MQTADSSPFHLCLAAPTGPHVHTTGSNLHRLCRGSSLIPQEFSNPMVSLAEAKLLQAAIQRDGRRRASKGPRRSTAGLPTLWRRLPRDGLSGSRDSHAFRSGNGAASPIPLCRTWCDRGWPRLAIAFPVDA